MLTDNERLIASGQGWQLIDTYDISGRWVLAAYPTDARLDSPFHAKSFIWEAAKMGDALCRKALSLITASEIGTSTKKPKNGSE